MKQTPNRWAWPGARWWCFDLHCHSEASLDYRGSGSVLAWLTAARDVGLHAIAVTDHNTADGIDTVLSAAQDVPDCPVVFPGVELTAACGTHILAILDPSAKADHVKEVLSKAKISVNFQGTSDARSPLSIEGMLEALRGNNVVLIAAHVNGPKGLLVQTKGRALAHILKHPALGGVEIVPLNPDGSQPAKHIDPSSGECDDWLSGKKPSIPSIAKIWCSDAHAADNLGSRRTWLKMTSPSVQGLRLALCDGDDSIRRTRDPSFNPNQHADNCIESIAIFDAKHMGRAHALTFNLNPWFNAVIGGRGTGKSTLLDTIRKVLMRDEELGERSNSSLRADFDVRMQPYADRAGPGLLTNATKISIIYRKHNERFEIEWDQSACRSQVYRIAEDDSRILDDSSIAKRFPVRIYSQKQLFYLAKQPNALLSVIDQADLITKSGVHARIAELEQEYISLRAQARLARTQAAELRDRRGELQDVRTQISLVREACLDSGLTRKYESLAKQEDAWATVKEEAARDLPKHVEERAVP